MGRLNFEQRRQMLSDTLEASLEDISKNGLGSAIINEAEEYSYNRTEEEKIDHVIMICKDRIGTSEHSD